MDGQLRCPHESKKIDIKMKLKSMNCLSTEIHQPILHCLLDKKFKTTANFGQFIFYRQVGYELQVSERYYRQYKLLMVSPV